MPRVGACPVRLQTNLDLSGRNGEDSSIRPGMVSMSVSSKCYYAIRAVYALAEHGSDGPMKIAEIAERELIPIRFLEVILNQLKGGGFVQSKRGAEGDNKLARATGSITVVRIMRYVAGHGQRVNCIG